MLIKRFYCKRPVILVQLEYFADIYMWSIKEVSKVKFGRQQQKQPNLSTPSDRCTIHLSDGKRLYIGLRRLAAANHPRDTGSIRQQQYQILIRPVEEGHGSTIH